MQIDLWGNPIEEKELLRDKFIEVPFSTLNARSGYWQARKQKWLQLGIKSELGRNAKCLAQGLNKFDYRASYTGTSVFDSALCELMYAWFCPDGGYILDPFCGGSVRGIVANYLGYHYTGIDIREEQIESDREQAIDILGQDNQPVYYVGDSNKVLDNIADKFDFVFSCPPYADLEVYSDIDGDISNMDYDDFMTAYTSIIKKSCNLLKDECYACFVVGEVRDKKGDYRGFVPDTINAFKSAGMKYYNEMILLENGLNTGAMRADKQFSANKKIVKVHQNVLVFRKRG